MNFGSSEDNAVFLSALEQLLEAGSTGWRNAPDWTRFDWSEALDAILETSGFLDCAAQDGLGLLSAAAMVHRVAMLPTLVEIAASATLRALFVPEIPRPLAVIEGGLSEPVRFLPVAVSVLHIGSDRVRYARLEPGSVKAMESIFAYPMGRLPAHVTWQDVNAPLAEVRTVWAIGIAAELIGVLKAGLDAVVLHVKQRHQFGRPLGSFQTIQQRLAIDATKIEAAFWLMLKAAQSRDPVDAAAALGYVQEASTKVIYDLHQFMGAMGLTLEHPLHRWSYRARLLRSSLGGPSESFETLSGAVWEAA